MNWKMIGASALAAGVGGTLMLRMKYRMPLKEYTQYALYMAVLDDQICRKELEGVEIGGKAVTFPEKSQSIQTRYHLHLRCNQGKSRQEIRQEIRDMEHRLEHGPSQQ